MKKRNMPEHELLPWLIAQTKADERGCLIWQGAFGGSGLYACTNWRGKLWRVTRLILKLNGVDMDGKFACHKCDNVKCVNPDHLFAGTPKENQLDCIAKGRKKTCPGEANHFTKLTSSIVIEILELLNRGMKQRLIGQKFGVTQAQISCIKRGIAWSHLTGIQRKKVC